MAEPTESKSERGLPGGIALPGALFALSMFGFAFFFTNPGLLDLGTNVSPAGLGILCAVVTLFWLLIAIAKRPPS